MTEPSISSVAYEALHLAREAKRDVEAHEDVCAERYENIHTALSKIETSFDKAVSKMEGNFDRQLSMVWKIIAWAGGAAFMIVMGLLGFLAKTQFDSMTALQKATVEHAQPAPPQVIIQRAPGQSEMGATVERQQQ